MDWKLRRLAGFTPRRGPLLIVVMDGVGLGRGDASDAVALARTPVLDWLRDHCPWVPLKAHGKAVGLPSDDDMGNSEVGHNALGAGRIFDQGAKLVNAAIASGEIFHGPVWRKLIARCVEHDRALHLIGLLSDGNVHSHQDHLHALIDQAHAAGVARLFVHALLDGRDVEATSALVYVERLEQHLGRYHGEKDRVYRIASGGGRMVTTMDRYQADWSIVERGWNAHVHGKAPGFASTREAIQTYRRERPGLHDEDLPPFVVLSGGAPAGAMRDGDSVLFFNFRGDRAIEISKAFEHRDFPYFDRGRRPDVAYAGMMEYDGDEHVPAQYLVAPPRIDRTMSEYLARNGVVQFACSETQKFGHVTYFWNGNRTGKFVRHLENYLDIRSDAPPFDHRPAMKAAEITTATIARLRAGAFRCGRINYANGDMVGHTGNRTAAIQAVAAVDLSLGRLLEAVRDVRGVALITADHGNSDEMYLRDDQGAIRTDPWTRSPLPRPSHSLNPVPCILYDPVGFAASGRTASVAPARIDWGDTADLTMPPCSLELPPEGAGLANVAATCLNLLGFEAPEDYAPSLLRVYPPVERV